MSMRHEIFWKNPTYKCFPKLEHSISCNVLVVGGGISGVSLAYFLAKNNVKDIVLIEKHRIASGATGKAAGSLVLHGESDLYDAVGKYGKSKGIAYWKETVKTLDSLKRIISKEHILCDAEPQDTLYCGFKGESYKKLHKEFTLQKEIDSSIRLLEGTSLSRELNTDLFDYGILIKNSGLSVNPLMLTQGLAKRVASQGTRIYENTHLVSHVGSVANTSGGSIKFKKLIFAVDAEHPSKKVKNLKSTIVVSRPLSRKELALTGLGKKKIVWDTKENYDYFKLTKDNRLLAGFGGIIVHKKHRRTDPHFPHLKQIELFIARLFPYLSLKIDYAWSGTFGVTDDYFPLVESKGNIFSISGAGTQVVCLMAASHLADIITGKRSNLSRFF